MNQLPPTVIVVDDEETVARFVAICIQRFGYRAVTAHTGRAALAAASDAALRHDLPSLLITDIDMPGMSGIELARTFGNLYPNVPVLFLTGLPTNAGLLDGADDIPRALILRKPFELRSLRDCIAKLMDNGNVRTHGAGKSPPYTC